MIYSATAKGGYKVPAPFDPNEVKVVGVIYSPDVWAAGKVYYKRGDDDYDIVIPSVFTGVYYKVSTPGLSGVAEPTWNHVPGETTTDGSVVWECVAYNLVPPTDTILTSTWATNVPAITLDAGGIINQRTFVSIATVPADITEFKVTNHVTKSNGEASDVTMVFKVAPR